MTPAAMPIERLDLPGNLRAKYFAPVAFCGYLFLLCIAIIVTAAFLKDLGESIAVTAVGVFGMVLACGLGALVLRMQLRELNYLAVATKRSATQNYAMVRALALDRGWSITREEPDGRLEARTPNTMFQEGELIAVRFRGQEVLVASICNPEVGFSLTGRDHCRQNRELVREAVQGGPRPAAGRA
jgi:hypothetical protein